MPTLENGINAVNISYFNFFNLREKIAEHIDPQLGKLYNEITQSFGCGNIQDFFNDYNKRLNEMEKSNCWNSDILDFLYASDCDGTYSVKKCKVLYEKIKDMDGEETFGFSTALQRKFTMNDFKDVLLQCIKNNKPLKWY